MSYAARIPSSRKPDAASIRVRCCCTRNADVDERLEQIIPLCESVAKRILRYSITEVSIATDSSHLSLVLMPIFQIGELVGSKTYCDALQETHPSDIWFQAYGSKSLSLNETDNDCAFDTKLQPRNKKRGPRYCSPLKP